MGKGRGKRSRPQGPPRRSSAAREPGTRGVLELDRFAEGDLERWARLSQDLDALHHELFFGFAQQRSTLRKELLEALREPEARPFEFADWVRIVPYRYCLSPLSAAGSLAGVGGRFNVGRDVPGDVITAWPALYVADSFETAYREKYGMASDARAGGALLPQELALQRPESITSVRVSGALERVFDLSDDRALAPFCKVLARCRMPARVHDLLRRLKIPTRAIRKVRSPADLRRMVMAGNWRQWPVQFEVPAHGQVLGSLLIEAGFEGVLYPSSKANGQCLAIFPQAIGSARTYVQLDSDHPDEVQHWRLDLESADRLSG